MAVSISATITTPLTLLQYAQTLPQSSAERVFIDNMVKDSDVLRLMPIVSATMGKKAFMDIGSLPAVGFRGLNEAGNQSTGTYNLREEDTFFIDEYVFVDRAMVDRLGPEQRYRQEQLKSIAIGQLASQMIIKGDKTLNPRQPDGLQARCTALSVNLFHNSAASGGAALSLANMDSLYWNVNRPTHWIVPRGLMPFWDSAARNNSLVNQTVAYAEDDFGRRIVKYKGLPILYGYEPDDSPDLLPLTEVASGGGGAVTGSIYCVRLESDQGVFLIEQTPMSIMDEGPMVGQPFNSTHIKWDWGIARGHPRAVARLDSIAAGAIVA
jgi:hypothetical protein